MQFYLVKNHEDVLGTFKAFRNARKCAEDNCIGLIYKMKYSSSGTYPSYVAVSYFMKKRLCSKNWSEVFIRFSV